MVALAACVEPVATDEPPPSASARLDTNGVDWNGVDWNGVDWNGVDWNGVDWNGVDWNGVDWNGIDDAHLDWGAITWSAAAWTGTASGAITGGAVDWNAIDWTDFHAPDFAWAAVAPPGPGAGTDWNQLEVIGTTSATPDVVAVHPRSRPLYVFVRARAGGEPMTIAIPSPGALAMIAAAPDRRAALYLLAKTWQLAYGPGFWMYAGRGDLDGDGLDGPIAVEGHYGVAPSLAGLGPYVQPQVEAWSSLVGSLLNLQPFLLSIRAFDVPALAADEAEASKYHVTDLRGVIGRILPPPDDPVQEPVLVLIRDRRYLRQISLGAPEMTDQLDQRRACPLDGQPWATCYEGRVTVVELQDAVWGGFGGCDGVAFDGPYVGTVSGSCWVDLPHVAYTQHAAAAPIAAAFVDMRLACPDCPWIPPEFPPAPPE